MFKSVEASLLLFPEKLESYCAVSIPYRILPYEIKTESDSVAQEE